MHFIPAVIVVLISLPYTTLPFSEKVKIAHHIQAVTQDYDFKISIFSLKQMMFIRPMHLFLYCILSLMYFKKATKKRLESFGALPSNHWIIERWIYLLISLQLFISTYCFLDSYTGFILKNDLGIFKYENYFRAVGSTFFMQNILLFLFPKILFDSISYPDVSLAKNRAAQIKKEKSLEINQTITAQIENYMLTSPYIEPGFNLSKMALDLKLSERVLSNYFNTELGISFSEWKIHSINVIDWENAADMEKLN